MTILNEDFVANDLLLVAQQLIRAGGGGMTDEEMEKTLERKHQTVSARRRDLVIAGLVKDSTSRRDTDSGRSATVWIWCGAGDISQARLTEIVRAARASKSPKKRARGKRHPLDIYGMVRRGREAHGRASHKDYQGMPGSARRDQLIKMLEAETASVRGALLMRDRLDLGKALARLVYLAMSITWEIGLDFEARFNEMHRMTMGAASERE